MSLTFFVCTYVPLSVSQEYASPALVQNKLEKARIVPAFLVTADQTDVYSVSLHHRTLSLLMYLFICVVLLPFQHRSDSF